MRILWKGVMKQVMVAMTASMGYMTIGLIRGFSSPGVPSMLEHDKHLVPNEYIISWVCAIPPLGAFIGSLVAGPLLQNIGRKHTLLLSAPIFILSWLAISYAQNYKMLIIARIMTGFCAGLTTPSAQVYVSECAQPEIRGILGSLPALFMACGVLISYIIGSFVVWDHLALVSALFPLMMMFFLLPLPESPVWLRNRGRMKDANKALKWLDQKPHIAKMNIYTVPPPVTQEKKPSEKDAMSDDEAKPDKDQNETRKSPYALENLLRRPVLVPFGLSCAILIFQQVSGIDTIIFYTVMIFQASNSSIGDYTATILVGLVQVIATSLAILIIDKMGRKPLLIISGLLMGMSMAVLGAYFYMKERHEVDNLGLLPVISLLVFMTGFSVGYCNIPFLLMGELLPHAQRSFLSSVAGSLNLGSMFLVIKTYPDIRIAIGDQGVFFLYSGLCFLSCIFVAVFLPETKGKSLQEIEEYFEHGFFPERCSSQVQSRKNSSNTQPGETQTNVKEQDKSETLKENPNNTQSRKNSYDKQAIDPETNTQQKEQEKSELVAESSDTIETQHEDAPYNTQIDHVESNIKEEEEEKSEEKKTHVENKVPVDENTTT